MKKIIDKYGKTNKQIGQEIIEFVNSNARIAFKETTTTFKGESGIIYEGKPDFYAFYSDYTWILFRQLFGTTMNLPKEFTYCKSLKQTLDEKL